MRKLACWAIANMAQEFDIVQEVLAQFEESNDLVGDVLAELVAGGPVQGFDTGGDVIGSAGLYDPWGAVPQLGSAGSAADMFFKSKIIQAKLEELEELNRTLSDPAVIAAKEAEITAAFNTYIAETDAADLLDGASSSTEAEFILGAKADQAGITDPDAKAAVVIAGMTAFNAGKAGAEIVTATVDGATGYVKDAITGLLEFFKKVPGVIKIDPITGTVTSKHETQPSSSGSSSGSAAPKIYTIPGTNTTVTLGGILGKILDFLKNGVDGEDILDVLVKVIVATTGVPREIVTSTVRTVIETTENPCDDLVYAARNPLECATIVVGTCSDPAYAAANPETCCELTCPDDSTPADCDLANCPDEACDQRCWDDSTPADCDLANCPDEGCTDTQQALCPGETLDGNCACPEEGCTDAQQALCPGETLDGNCDCPTVGCTDNDQALCPGETLDENCNCPAGTLCDNEIYALLNPDICADQPPAGGGGFPSGGTRTMSSEQMGVADLGLDYDIGGKSIFVPPAGASGGKIESYDIVDELENIFRRR